ncbi:MAG: hypothetical protein WDN50_06395 [Bradyrhizobium sp.]
MGVGASELMTTGGHVSFGASAYFSGPTAVSGANVSSVVIKQGAVIDISGGWVTYQAGTVVQSKLITADGHLVNIGSADPNGDYVGVYNGYIVGHDRWGVQDVYVSPLLGTSHYEASYNRRPGRRHAGYRIERTGF